MINQYGIAFHYFYGRTYKQTQGSITQKQLEEIIEKVNVISANEWISNRDKGMCLTFDDRLRCQYDIALPLLNKYDLTAMWFVNTSKTVLEIFRRFRNHYYQSVEEFYKAFFYEMDIDPETIQTTYLQEHSFYSKLDRKFRYIRDVMISHNEYIDVMKKMMKKKNTNMDMISQNLWIEDKELKQLKDNGHIIGLHSHSHPTNMKKLPIERQINEYKQNFEILCDIIEEKPITVAHPCNSYDSNTLQILKNLGIKYGFVSNIDKKKFTDLELPRIDAVSMLQQINQLRERYKTQQK